MKHKILLLLVLFSALLLSSKCDNWPKPTPDDSLSLPLQNYTGTEIKTDGYWYDVSPDSDNNIWFNIYFFYENGVIFGGTSVQDYNLEMREEEFRNGTYYESSFDIKHNWGVFVVDSPYIAFERWYPNFPPLHAYVRAGKIINDTTFVITESYRMVDGQKTEMKDRNETYHFKKFCPKPDSTNSFIP